VAEAILVDVGIVVRHRGILFKSLALSLEAIRPACEEDILIDKEDAIFSGEHVVLE